MRTCSPPLNDWRHHLAGTEHRAGSHDPTWCLIAANLGDGGPFVYKKTRRGNTELDSAVRHALENSGHQNRVIEFSPYGYDERQYGSPGFNPPVGSLTRTPYGEFAEYHTSADDLDFVSAVHLAESLRVYLSVLEILEGNATLLNASPMGEPELGRRGLYRTIGHGTDQHDAQLAMLWVLNMSDGDNSLLDMAERSGLPFGVIRSAADALIDAELLVRGGSPHTI